MAGACARRGDALILRGMRFFGRHGVLDAERALGQRFVVDMRVGACLRAAGASDDLRDTINYASLRDIAREVVEGGPPRRLVERVAADIAARVLDEHPRASDVCVAIAKPHVAVPDVDSLGVEVYRRRGK
jgi:7,8-dihydroneopterin aldolase/epimerase/oxygenase